MLHLCIYIYDDNKEEVSLCKELSLSIQKVSKSPSVSYHWV